VTRTSIPFFPSTLNNPLPHLLPKNHNETAKMFMKQYNYKPRTNSQSSQSGSGKAIERTDNAAQADSPPAKADTTSPTSTSPVSAAVAGRRRVCLHFFGVSYLEAEAATRGVSHTYSHPRLSQFPAKLSYCYDSALHMANTASPCSRPT
jgi:hypothetical protein